MATQNPIEQEGTYSLPEAQLDRFLMHVRIDYPSVESEQSILHLVRAEARAQGNGYDAAATGREGDAGRPIDQSAIFAARDMVIGMYMSDQVEKYLLQLVLATRSPAPYSDKLAKWIQYGGSPRATIALDRCARAQAWLDGRDYVSPEDVQSVCGDVLRHRLLLHYEAEAEGVTPDQAIDELLGCIAVP